MVYVDSMEAPFGRLIMCHMIADTHDELVGMARKIGVQEKWIQYPGTYKEHFDICKSKRAAAVVAGATEITMREFARRVSERREKLCQQLTNSSHSMEPPSRS
jgi:hypothetical protein